MDISLNQIQEQFEHKIKSIKDLKELDLLRVEFLGKKGYVAEAMKLLGVMVPEERKSFGVAINTVRDFIVKALTSKKQLLEDSALQARLQSEAIDITLPAWKYERGKRHPIHQVIHDVQNIFATMGFIPATGPEIEDDWHNFTALNIPESHPARQMHDTFYIENTAGTLLRTHTSPVQIRHMMGKKPPFKIISAGRVYRSDYDATHTPMFHQIEGLYIDRNVTIAHLKGCLETFLRLFFQVDEAPIRLRPSYFPFTEPSAEVDVRCDRSNKAALKIGYGSDWLEILGCGMVHPKVLQNVGVDPNEYQGFAFGVGVERLAMLKYNIPDLRTFFESDIRWLQHFGT